MIIPHHDTNGHPGNVRQGCWDRIVLPDGKTTAAIACPTCNHLFSVANHTINAGACSPSVVCPWSGCTFHEFLVLEGW